MHLTLLGMLLATGLAQADGATDCADLVASHCTFTSVVTSTRGSDYDASGSCSAPSGYDSEVYYDDGDGDGYGGTGACCVYTGSGSIRSCDPGAAGFADNSEDCDDGDPYAFPGAAESGPFTASCTRDADEDGWGDDSPTNPDVDPGYDCDDDDPAANPDQVETWYDGTDQDCDGASDYDQDGDGQDHEDHGGFDCVDDDAGTYLAAADEEPTLCTIDADGDGFGSTVPPSGADAGTDCDDEDADINPDAPELCDGQDNDCDGLEDDEDELAAGEGTDTYLDADGDGYGTSAETANTCSTVPSGYASVGGDCDDDYDHIYPGAPEICDGVITDCDQRGTGITVADVVPDELDPDNDGYLECNWTGAYPYLGNQSGIQAGEDCDPDDGDTYPGADEECDGVYNNCTASSYSATSAPDDELDDDGDGYVDCEGFSSSGWKGSSAVVGGEDCDDDAATVYPGATEECDGQFNDCSASLYGSQSAPDDELDEDTDFYVECTGWDGSTWVGASTVVGGDDCDPSDDAVYPGATEQCDGRFNDCSDPDLETAEAPDDELDEDGDGYVECTYTAGDWAGDADVVGGDDCDDEDDSVYPAAAEVCDGQYNDCEDGTYSDSSAPDDEEDGDGDGFVECVRYPTVAWNPADGISPDPLADCYVSDCFDCDDTDPYTFPGAATEETDSDETAECMRDGDGDGWGDEVVDGDEETAGLVAGSDCDDTDDSVNPGEPEVCETGSDQVDNDCDGNVNTEGGEVVDTGSATRWLDEDGDGFGDEQYGTCGDDEGFVDVGQDCDDTDSGINPGAAEVCDNLDQDCDFEIDEWEDLGEDSGCTTLYRDVDEDGYGDAAQERCLCIFEDSTTYDDGTYQWVRNDKDCDDYAPSIHPRSCDDAVDNDLDGYIDADDPECQEGLSEDGEAVEGRFEVLDGDDNDCDGYVALVELDCDDDGSLPLLPQAGTTIASAAEAGLAACSEGETRTFDCWTDQPELVLECDEQTGLWVLDYEDSEDAFGGRYESGSRSWPAGDPACSTHGDCDDHCASRCPDLEEGCDGIDNDCTEVRAGDDDDGVPDSMDPDVALAGELPSVELDLDLDGYLSCTDGLMAGSSVLRTSASCADAGSDEALEEDCNDLCVLTSPGRTEACNGFTDVCEGEGEGSDADGDGRATCGAWGDPDAVLATDEIYILVWARDLLVEEVTGGGSVETEAEASPPPAPGPAPAPADTGAPAGDTADTAAPVDSGASDSGSSGDTAASDFRDLAEVMVPVVLPRVCPGDAVRDDLRPDPSAVCDCDVMLYDALAAVVGADALDFAIQEQDPSPLVEACFEEGAACSVVRLTLDEAVDETTFSDHLDPAASAGLVPAACEEAPAQWISRTVWSAERTVQARQAVVAHECRRLFGEDCEDIDDSSELVAGYDTLASISTDYLEDYTWWMELRRYSPESVTEGTVGWCWGDPTESGEGVSEETAGDCADGVSEAHRGQPEGPGDLLGAFTGEAASCDTCLDGIDNNCDGQIDCADPACAACFVGEGTGCGGGSESPCAQGGCAVVPAPSREPRRVALLSLLALGAALLRRRIA